MCVVSWAVKIDSVPFPGHTLRQWNPALSFLAFWVVFLVIICFCCVRFNSFGTRPGDWLVKNVSKMTSYVSDVSSDLISIAVTHVSWDYLISSSTFGDWLSWILQAAWTDSVSAVWGAYEQSYPMLCPVSTGMSDYLWRGIQSQYVTSQLGHLSFASLQGHEIVYRLNLAGGKVGMSSLLGGS